MGKIDLQNVQRSRWFFPILKLLVQVVGGTRWDMEDLGSISSSFDVQKGVDLVFPASQESALTSGL